MAGNSRKPKSNSARHRGAATIADIAREAGVSKMTVSRVLSAPLTVREETRERVVRIIAELHYTPNRSARMLSGARQLRFGLLHNNPRSSYIMDFLMGAIEQASLMDVQLIARGCRLGEDDAAMLNSLIGSGIDAIILTPPLCDSPVLLDLVRGCDLPGLLVSTDAGETTISSIFIDETAAAREMTEHLLALGHRRIGFIAGEPALAASHARQAGFVAALDAAGVALDPALVAQGDFTYRTGLDAADRLLTLPERPTAILASNDDMAAAAVMTARRLGLDVPAQLSVCGFDDSWIATATYPELTTIRQPIAEMATRGVMLLAELAQVLDDGDRTARHVMMPHELIVRGSATSVPEPERP
ncbi:MAG: LacI family DNA-binding transcriptional regulator [Sphingomonas phyllosphaerae]|uniref:LacI family DNA-binding transcriptional regulator n=1 Tax=Sphingomonas phyllosphaerae TaxID=257003 RepID=UPI002FF93C7C